MARRAAVRLGVPAMIVAALAVAALWRIGRPPQQSVLDAAPTSGAVPAITEPLKSVAELMSQNAVGREASLEHVTIRERLGDRFFWIGTGDQRPVFVVLDPDVRRSTEVTLRPGAQLTLVGIVRPVPTASEAERQWHVPSAAAAVIADSGTYLHATEIRR